MHIDKNTLLAQYLYMTDYCLRKLDNSKLVVVVRLDFSAAFDVNDHELLTELFFLCCVCVLEVMLLHHRKELLPG